MDCILNHSAQARNGVRFNRNSRHQVLRSTLKHGAHFFYDHRTGSGIAETLHSPPGELHRFFTSLQKFRSISEQKIAKNQKYLIESKIFHCAQKQKHFAVKNKFYQVLIIPVKLINLPISGRKVFS